MRTLTALLHRRWAIPGVSGLLIVVSILGEGGAAGRKTQR